MEQQLAVVSYRLLVAMVPLAVEVVEWVVLSLVQVLLLPQKVVQVL
jgi:hypothetical protein